MATRMYPPTVPMDLPEGRIFLVFGPFCWGKAPDRDIAERNAKKNWSRSYAPKWSFILYDAPSDASVDDFGYVRWKDGTQELKELYRHNVKADNAVKKVGAL